MKPRWTMIVSLVLCFCCVALAADNSEIPWWEWLRNYIKDWFAGDAHYGFVEIDNQVFREAVDIAGTPYSLCYTSWRVKDNLAAYSLDIPLFDSSDSEDLTGVRLTLSVTNRTYTYEYGEPLGDNIYNFHWDGLDADSNTVKGVQHVMLDLQFDFITYTYVEASLDTVILNEGGTGSDRSKALKNNGLEPATQPIADVGWPEPEIGKDHYDEEGGPQTGGGFSGSWSMSAAMLRVAKAYSYSLSEQATIGVLLAEDQGLGGWTVEPHHWYDPAGQILFRGDGDHRPAEPVGTAACVFSGGQSGPSDTNMIAIVSQDGSELYLFDAAGKHLHTRDTLTGSTNVLFTYSTNALLTGVTDRDGNVTTIERNAQGQPTALIAPFGQRTELALDANGYLSAVVNPASETNSFQYTSGGLLTNVVSRRGNVFSMTYNGLGRLVRAEDPAGGYDEYSRTRDFGYYEIVSSSAMGRTNTYRGESLPGSFSKRTESPADGTTFERYISQDETIESHLYADGTIVDIRRGPDPRFDMQVPRQKSQVITMPSGLASTTQISRAVTLSDTNDLLSVVVASNSVTVNGQVYISRYNAADRTTVIETPEGREYSVTHDMDRRPIQLNRPGMHPLEAGYNEEGQLDHITWGTGTVQRVLYLGYATNGYLQALTNSLDQRIGLGSDSIGRVTNIVRPDDETIGISYDPCSHVAGVTPPGKPPHAFGYSVVGLMDRYTAPDIGEETNIIITRNEAREITGITHPGGIVITNEYAASGLLEAVQWPEERVEVLWDTNDNTGLIESMSCTSGPSLAFSFDGSLLTSILLDGTITGMVSYSYNNDFRIETLEVNDANSISYGRDDDGLLTTAGALTLNRSAASGFLTNSVLSDTSDIRTFNGFGELESYSVQYLSSNVFDVDLEFDKLGRITNKTEAVLGVTNIIAYSYDDAGRLIRAADQSYTNTYEYDANGNRTNAAVGGTSATGVYDAQDRMTTYGSVAYQYSPSGSLTNKTDGGDSMNYRYDAMGNLLSVSTVTSVVQYELDPMGRRIGKKVDGSLAQGFLYKDMLNPVAELDEDNEIVSLFVYASRRYVPDYIVKTGSTYRIITDHLGSVRLVINADTGEIAQRIDYDEFGRVTNDTNPGFQPFGFAGGLYDPDTGLVRFGYRDYDAETGRWLSKDPILFAGGQANLYTYCHGDPVNWADPYGLSEATTIGLPWIIVGGATVPKWVPPVAAGAVGWWAGWTIGSAIREPLIEAGHWWGDLIGDIIMPLADPHENEKRKYKNQRKNDPRPKPASPDDPGQPKMPDEIIEDGVKPGQKIGPSDGQPPIVF